MRTDGLLPGVLLFACTAGVLLPETAGAQGVVPQPSAALFGSPGGAGTDRRAPAGSGEAAGLFGRGAEVAFDPPRAIDLAGSRPADPASPTPFRSAFVRPIVTITVAERARTSGVQAFTVQNIELIPRRAETPLAGALTSAYGSLVLLQTLDAHSTLRALDSGLVEANPVMRWIVSRGPALVAAKSAAAAGTVFFAEQIRKRSPRAAMLFITLINAAYTAVVIHNYRAVPGTRGAPIRFPGARSGSVLPAGPRGPG
jgi:hypothetical protein